METLTSTELKNLREQLTQEENLIAKYRFYAFETQDEELRSKYEEIAERHQKHFNTLYTLIG